MTIPELEQLLKEIATRVNELNSYTNKLDDNLMELRRQLGVERAPTHDDSLSLSKAGR